jgi:hypothetical protein
MLTTLLMFTQMGMVASGIPVAALAPLVVVAVAFVAFCLVDVWRSESVRYLPRWAWTIICIVSVPLGGIVYLVVGRQR